MIADTTFISDLLKEYRLGIASRPNVSTIAPIICFTSPSSKPCR